MSTITSTGLGSGLDINSLVDSLTEAERAPTQDRIDLRKSTADATISGVGRLKSALDDFQSALAKLNDASDLETTSASSSDETIFSATADATAQQGTYEIEVEQLATTNKWTSGALADDELVGKGVMTFSVNGDSFSLDVGVNDTLADVRNNINAASDNVGVRATLITSDDGVRLVLTAAESGTENALTISAVEETDDADPATGLSRLDATQLTETQPGLDSKVRVDGQLVTSSSNLVEGAITGVTLALDKADDNAQYTLSLFPDPAGLEDNITEMVNSYNALLTTASQLQFGTVDEEGNEIPPLMPNDSTLRSLMTQLRRSFSSSVEGAGNFSSLATLGVSTNRDGSIVLNSGQLQKALASGSGLTDIAKLFSTDGTGVANKLFDQVSSYLKFDGVLDQRIESAQSQLERLAKDQTSLDLRLEKYQARLFTQFNKMDSIVGSLTSTGSYLDQQLSLLSFAGGYNKDN